MGSKGHHTLFNYNSSVLSANIHPNIMSTLEGIVLLSHKLLFQFLPDRKQPSGYLSCVCERGVQSVPKPVSNKADRHGGQENHDAWYHRHPPCED